MIVAAIGIGSNSMRMLVADVANGTGRRLLRDRQGTRLFAGLDEQRNLSQEALNRTCTSAAGMAAKARAMGAEEIHLFATSAVRDAANADVLAERLQREAGLTLQVCSGQEEAALSFIGASGGGYAGVIDIGGGSTEFVVGEGDRLDCSFSCQMGAVRLFGMRQIASSADLPAVEQLADDILQAQLAVNPGMQKPDKWIGTGGTFTTLAAMVKGIPWTERTYMHGTDLKREVVRELAVSLADMSVEERMKLPGLQPNRADIIVHGICILLAAMERLDIPSIQVSEYGNLDGYIRRTYALTDMVNAGAK